MRIVTISMMKNEADIVEAFVRHTLAFCDALVVLENQSVDPTRQILQALAGERLPLIVIDDAEVAYAQSEKMSNLLITTVAHLRPDWVLLLDADEFIVCPDRPTLERALAAVPVGTVPRLPWRGYVPTPDDDPSETNPIRRIRHRRSAESRSWGKIAVPRREYEQGRLVIGQGNHELRRLGADEPIPTETVPDVWLAHFPVRSSDQLIGKAITGWLAYLSDPATRVLGVGGHWQRLYEMLVDGHDLSSDDLQRIAVDYGFNDGPADLVEEPIPSTALNPLRYTRFAGPAVALAKVARTAEQIARRVSEAPPTRPRWTAALRAAWEDDPARAGFDEPPLRLLVDRFRPRSVLYVGSAMPTSCQIMSGWGIDPVMAIDGVDQAFELGRQFDLVVALEILQHVRPDREQAAIAAIAHHARDLVVFSAGQPGQPSSGQNLRPVQYWMDRWRENGWETLPFVSLSFRLVANYLALQRNALVLSRRGREMVDVVDREAFGTHDLTASAGPVQWRPQAIRTFEHTLLGDRLHGSYVRAMVPGLGVGRRMWRRLPWRARMALRNQMQRILSGTS
jgi:hypothetical protein